jgi:hypothetical protein
MFSSSIFLHLLVAAVAWACPLKWIWAYKAGGAGTGIYNTGGTSMRIVKGFVNWALVGICLMALVCALVASSNESVGDTSPRLLDNPVYRENATLSDGVWEVTGSLIVMNGTLTLDNATIVFNSTPKNGLEIAQEGSLVCVNSTIKGAQLSFFNVHGPATFIDSSIGDFTWWTIINIFSTTVVMEGCQINGWGLVVEGNLVVRNCTFDGRRFAIVGGNYNGAALGDYSILLENSTVTGRSYVDYAVILSGPDIINRSCNATIRNCTIGPYGYGLMVRWFKSYGNVVFEDNEIDVAHTGVYLEEVGRHVDVGRSRIWASIGLRLMIPFHSGPRVHNLTINSDTYGVMGFNRNTNFTLYHLNITSNYTGMEAHDFHVTLENCTINSSDYYVVMSGRTFITLIDCVHGSRIMRYGLSQLIAKRTVEIEKVKWAKGPDIIKGTTNVYTVNNTITGIIDNEAPGPLPLTYWYVNETIWDQSEKVFAVYSVGGEDFYSDLYPMLNVTSLVMSINDHLLPEVTVTSPRLGLAYNTTTLEVLGTCTDMGSGIAILRARCDNGPWSDATFNRGGKFNITISVPTEGDHVIEVTARDYGGNTVDVWIGGVLTDITLPFIIVESPSHWTNQSEVQLVVLTEKLSRVFLNDIPIDVDFRGTVAVWLSLVEGVTPYHIRVIDRAGNVNETWYSIELDTDPPMLLVDYPEQGGWVNESTFQVQGATEEYATVYIDHESVERKGVAFFKTIEAPDGELTILIEATDRAGNHAVMEFVVTVDTKPPQVTIETPNIEEVTSVSTVTFSGLASDNYHISLTVKGWPVEVIDGRWTITLDLDEGWQHIDIIAKDLAGNSHYSTLTFLLDSLPPEVTIGLVLGEEEHVDPSIEIVTGRTLATLRLNVNEACEIQITGHGIESVPEGISTLNLTLVENDLNVLEIIPYDLLGNQAEAIIFRVSVDTIRPTLEIVEPSEGMQVPDPLLTIIGVTEPGAHIYIQGIEMPVEEIGMFRAEVVLYEGVNWFEIEAMDEVGNRANITLSVLYEPPPDDSGEEDGPLDPLWVVIIGAIACGSATALFLRRRRAKYPS